MAIMDAFLEFSDNQNINMATNVSGVSTNIVDLGANGLDKWATLDTLYAGDWRQGDLYLNVQTARAAQSSGGDITISLRGADSAAACTQTGGVQIIASGPISRSLYSVPGSKLWQTAIPRVDYEFMYLKVACPTTNCNIFIDAWVGKDAEFGHMDVV